MLGTAVAVDEDICITPLVDVDDITAPLVDNPHAGSEVDHAP